MNENVTAKVTARGTYQGKPLTVEVLRYGDGFAYAEEFTGIDYTKRLTIVVNGKEFIVQCELLAVRQGEDIHTTFKDKDYQYVGTLMGVIYDRYEKSRKGYGYRASSDSIEAYWLAFNYGDGFDDVPEITVEGEIYTRGAPFSDEDTSGVVF